MKTTFFVLLLLVFTQSLFDENSAVFKLTANNFKSSVLDSDEFWLVEFYAPWCGHCKKSAPQFQQAAEILTGIINVGAVDMTTDQAAGAKYNVQGYPTIKFFGSDKNKPIDYNSSQRTFDKFVEYSLEQLKKEIKTRRANLEAQAQSNDL